MRIRAKGGIKHHPYNLTEGDEITVPDEVGAMFVANGWAVNVDTGEDNAPNLSPVTLDIHNGILGHTSEIK